MIQDFKVGDRVHHVKEPMWTGTIVHLDSIITGYDVTTALVVWDDAAPGDEPDIQWTNKLCKREEEDE